MVKKSNRHIKNIRTVIRFSESELEIAKRLAQKAGARNLTQYMRAAILNHQIEDKEYVGQTLIQIYRLNAQLEAAHDCKAKERAMASVEDVMLKISEQ